MRRWGALPVAVMALSLWAPEVSAAGAGRGRTARAGAQAATARNHRAASRDALELLARLRLPSGSTLHESAAAEARSGLPALEATTTHAGAAQVWWVPGAIDSVFAYVRGHAPHGSTRTGTGYTDRPGQPPSERDLTFSWPPVGRMLADRVLHVSISSLGSGQTRVYAQAESIWIVARPLSEHIPPATRTVTITARGAGRPTRTARITRRGEVRRIVAAFNALEIVQPGWYSCPGVTLDGRREVSFAFRDDSSRELARAAYFEPTTGRQEVPGPCEAISLTIGDRTQHPLLGDAAIPRIQSLIGA